MMLNVESFQVIVSKIVERSLTKELKRELYIECWCRPPPAPAQTESQHINVFNRVEIGRSFRRRVAMAEDCCKRIKIEAFVPPQPSPPGHVSTFKYQTHCSVALLFSSVGTVVITPTMEFQKQRTGHWYGIFVCLLPLINLGAAMRLYQSLPTLFLVLPQNRLCLLLGGGQCQWTRNVTIQNFSMVTIQAADWIRMGAEIWSRESKSNAIDGIF